MADRVVRRECNECVRSRIVEHKILKIMHVLRFNTEINRDENEI